MSIYDTLTVEEKQKIDDLFERAREETDLPSLVAMHVRRLRPSGGGYKGQCPFTANHPAQRNKSNFTVFRSVRGGWVYNCLSPDCDGHGDAIEWEYRMGKHETRYDAVKALLGISSYRQADHIIEAPRKPVLPPVTNDPLPEEPVKRFQHYMNRNPHAIQWWKDQGLNEESIEKWQVGYNPSFRIYDPEKQEHQTSPTFTFPVYSCGKLRTIRHRIMNPITKHDKYRPHRSGDGSWLFNFDAIQPGKDILIVAGEKKVIVIDQYVGDWLPSISATSGCTSWFGTYGEVWSQFLIDCPLVYIGFDPGEKEAAERTAMWFGRRARLVVFPQKPDDLLVDNEDGLVRFFDCIGNAQPIRT